MEINRFLKKKQKALKEKNEGALCSACSDLADYYMKEEKFLDAINEYVILATLYKKQKKMIDFATVNRGMGEAYMMLTNYEKAIEHQKIYLGVSREHENLLEEQRALATLGHTYLTKYIGGKKDKNDLNLAYKYTLKSLGVCDSLTDIKKYEVVDMTARLYNNLGVIQEYQGHHDKSMEFFNKAIVLCKANDVYESLYQAYNSLASLYERKGEYNNAIPNFNLAIEAARKLRNNSSALCDCLVSKSNILLKLGDFQAAKKSLQKAYKLKLATKLKEDVEKKLKLVVTLYRTEKELVSRTCSDTELQKFYEKMGDAFSGLSCFGSAIEYYLKMLQVAQRTNINLASCYYSLAVTYRDDEQFDKAVEYFEKEYALCEFKKGLDTLCEIADTKESSDCLSSEVTEVYKRAVNICKKANNQREEGRMLNRLIDYLERSGNTELIFEYQKQFNETGFVPSDSEESPPEVSSEDDVSLNNLTDVSEDSECDSPSKKRRSKNFQIRRNLRGETQLHTACISGKINVVQHLLDQGHPVNIRDNGGWLPIHDACISGHFEIVKLLLDKGAAVNDRGGTHCNGITPLHDAAVNGHLDIIELLLNRGASALAKTDEGETAYHYLKKTSLDMQFDDENKKKCEKLLDIMSAVLDKAGQSREINCNIKNAAFVSGEVNEHSEIGDRRRCRVSKQNVENFPEERSSSDEDIDELVVKEKKAVLPRTQATNEYKMVMDSLRKKPVELYSSSVPDITSTKRSAFVMLDETNDDYWLEDDLGGTKNMKKRKINYTDGLINSSHTRLTSSMPKSDGQTLKRCDSLETVSSKSSKSSRTSNSKSPTKRSKNRDSFEILNVEKGGVRNYEEDYNSDQFLADNNQTVHEFSDDEVFDENRSKSKQQMSLLDAGFVRSTTPSDNYGRKGQTSQKRTLQPKITHYRNTTPTKTSQLNTNRSSFSPQKWTQSSPHKSLFIDDDPMLALDVNIEGRPFRVTTRMSLKNTLTVKWLGLEAARRYAKKEYVEPVLELTTESGAELVDDDPIGTLFITDSQVVEVHAKVLKWNLPLVRERYKEACSDMETKPLDSICHKLDTMTISLDIKNNGFLPQTMAPLCKALLRENRLLELDLSNNFLSLDCIKLLTATLPTLENLTKLNLCCTNLHTEEIRCLSNMFSCSPTSILPKLYSLDLSENFIRDESLQDICTLTKHLNLKELNLSLLNFTDDCFKQSYNKSATFNLERVEMLNLMGNNFGNDALLKILSFVDPAALTHLDVSNNRTTAGFVTSLIQCLNKDDAMINLEYLDLNRCLVEDMEVFSLLRSSENLETLNLSHTQLTSLSLRRLLESPVVRNIILLGCHNINKYFDDSEKNWILENHCSNKKSLKISCDSEQYHFLINLWKNKYCDKALIEEGDSLLSLEGKV